ncbi:MAG TPA: cyclic pyranopterin monophosphate synthase MoaC [Nitrososphaerales archaeon]|nr:cyclic pyranopterin monophosphate synthase MoaC [Nitrososphaerales archaeon]
MNPASKMIDISQKPEIRREAVAEGIIHIRESTLELIESGKIEKGDPLQIASVGAIQAIKSTPHSLMMCHPILIESSSVEFAKGKDWVQVRVSVVAHSKTGVEMEALNAVSNALLNIWDVVKKYEKNEFGQYPETRIENIHVVKKSKGEV